MLNAQGISKVYNGGGAKSVALNDVSLTVTEGEFVCILGRSGSGKTTLLSVLSTLLRPTTGSLSFEGVDLARLAESKLNTLRRDAFATIFQMNHLLPYLTVMENVALPCMGRLRPVTSAEKDRAREAIGRVGLTGKEHRLPGQLSGGEQQRVAIARALINRPRILFADEPTGSLDKTNGNAILELLSKLNADGHAVVMVTHQEEYATAASRIVRMEDGRVVDAA